MTAPLSAFLLLHELHNLKDRGLTRRFSIITAAINSPFLAHSQPEYRKLGPFVADIHLWAKSDDYYNQYRQRDCLLLTLPTL